MLDILGTFFEEEIRPALRVLGVLTIQALDSLPLPILIVGFLALLALLQWPPPKNSQSLPHYSPSLYEKSRLSPIPFSPPSVPFPQPRTLLHPGYSLDPSSNGSSASTRPQYVAVVNSDIHVLHDSGSSSPPRAGCGSANRRGSKQRDWRRNSAGGSLAPVVESSEGELLV